MKNQISILLFSLILLGACTKEGILNESFDLGEGQPSGGERYNDYDDNPFIDALEEPISTFSIDADGGAYSNVRRFLNSGQLPPKGAVRIEEFINFFPFDYSYESSEHPLSLNGEVAECPWTDGHKIIRIGMIGKPLSNPRPASNIVFLIDVSGSMNSNDKLPLLKYSFKELVKQLNENDNVAIVTYSGSAGVPLPATSGDQKDKINQAINSLGAGGSTAGGAGITKAYEIAQSHFKEGGNNRIILGTDGDFNVGVSSEDELIKLIEEKRDMGIFLTVCGVGTGNYQEGTMEQLADHGNGTYEYIDSEAQGRKVFVEEFYKFFTVAQDVKVQIVFNTDVIKRYRLIGYENRVLKEEDFADDTKDAGELAAGQTVTALYEVETVNQLINKTTSMFTIDFRYKNPGGQISKQMKLEIKEEGKTFEQASESLRFASGLAAFGMLLRDSPYFGTCDFDKAKSWIQGASDYNPNGYKTEIPILIDKAKFLK